MGRVGRVTSGRTTGYLLLVAVNLLNCPFTPPFFQLSFSQKDDKGSTGSCDFQSQLAAIMTKDNIIEQL
jgi:hypothetical protein